MNKINILFLIPSLVGGGAERALINLLNNIDRDRYQIDLAVLSYTGVYISQVPCHVKVIPLFRNHYLVRILLYLQKKFGVDFILKRRVEKKLNANYNISISYIDSSVTDLLFYLNRPGKIISWVHGSYKSNPIFQKDYTRKGYKLKLINKRYSKLDSVVFVSKDSKKEFIDYFGEYPSMPVVYNLIDQERLKIKSKEFHIEPTKKLTFIAVGSLYPVKGYEMLIKACKILKDKGFDFSVNILGRGFLQGKLSELITELNLDDRVNLLGFKNNPYPYVLNSDVYIMTSISEALPVALCEAMILEKPVLVTNASGCREIINEGEYGLLVEKDAASIAKGMEKFLVNNKLLKYYTEKSKERAVSFKDESILKEHHSLFENLIK